MRTRNLLPLALLVPLLGCLETECKSDDVLVDIDSLPVAVTDAIEAAYPGSTLMEAEEEDDGYEVGVRDADGTLWEVEVSAAGEILEAEQDDGDDDEDEDGECGDDEDEDEDDEDDDGGDDDDDGEDDEDDDD